VRIGVISDTHGVLSSAVHDAFADVECIIHAGDIGRQVILDELESIAPVSAVEGNTDNSWAHRGLPGRLVVECEGVRVLVGHKLPDLVRAGIPADVDAVVYGHTHVAAARDISGVWYVNPGSAYEPRDGSAPSVAVIDVTGGRVSVRHIFL